MEEKYDAIPKGKTEFPLLQAHRRYQRKNIHVSTVSRSTIALACRREIQVGSHLSLPNLVHRQTQHHTCPSATFCYSSVYIESSSESQLISWLNAGERICSHKECRGCFEYLMNIALKNYGTRVSIVPTILMKQSRALIKQ